MPTAAERQEFPQGGKIAVQSDRSESSGIKLVFSLRLGGVQVQIGH